MEKEKLYSVLNSFKTKTQAYKYFNITPNSKGILKLKDLANSVEFDLELYKERRKPPKRYCKYCNKNLNKINK